MRDDVRQALANGRSLDLEGRTIDITTKGRRSGEPRRIEIAFYWFEDSIYLSGIPGPRIRDWLANLTAEPHFTFHLSTASSPICRLWLRSSPIRRSVVACSPTSSSNSTSAMALTVSGRRLSSKSGWRAVRWQESAS